MKFRDKISKISFLFLLGIVLSFSGCIKDPPDGDFVEDPEPVDCFVNITGPCNYLSQHEIMLFLSKHSCSGYCVMKKFLQQCPDEIYINADVLNSEQYLTYFYEDQQLNLDSVLASGVLVHESMHSVTSQLPAASNQIFIMLDCNTSWDVTMFTHFASDELIAVIPVENRTQRFDGYVDAVDSHVTQTRGVYGLLNEFTAYFQGALATLEVGKSKNLLSTPFSAALYAGNGVVPYYEFRYWILTYLIYAEDQHPAIFNSILSNAEFKESFLAIDVAYEAVATELRSYSDPLDGSNMTALKNVIDEMNTTPYLEMLDRLAQ